jgi:hypothetical protein
VKPHARLAAVIARQGMAEAEMRPLHRSKPVPQRWSSTGREVVAALEELLQRPIASARPDHSGTRTTRDNPARRRDQSSGEPPS